MTRHTTTVTIQMPFNGERGCPHRPEEIRAGNCEYLKPEDLPLLRVLAGIYSDRPGYEEAWARDRDR